MKKIHRLAKEVQELQHAWTQLKSGIAAECDSIVAAAGGEHDVIRNDDLTTRNVGSNSPAASKQGGGGTGDPSPPASIGVTMPEPMLAVSLIKLREQINIAFPKRSKVKDGWIGDAAHRSKGAASDHNPWYQNTVTAIDITADPTHGVDTDILSDQLANSRDRRIKYIIANGYILDSRPGNRPWEWVKYRGSDPHTGHMHISVMNNWTCNDSSPWNIPLLEVYNNMALTDKVKSELNGNTLLLGHLFGWWDKWIVETHRQASRIDEVEIGVAECKSKLDQILAILELQAELGAERIKPSDQA